jgi:hypothetical protein
MRTDIALGAITLLMAVLGGVVSAHAPDKGWQKILYFFGFIALGIAGMCFVFRQSNETTVANRDLSHSIHDLSVSSQETARLQRLNTDLQNKLLAQAGAISRLTQENADLITGGNSYPFILPILGKIDNLPGFPLTIVVRGKHDLLDVSIAVSSPIQDVTGTNPPKTESRETFLQAWNAGSSTNLRFASHSQATILPLRIEPVGERDVFYVGTTCRNGYFWERLVMKRFGDAWMVESEKITNLAGKILEQWTSPIALPSQK